MQNWLTAAFSFTDRLKDGMEQDESAGISRACAVHSGTAAFPMLAKVPCPVMNWAFSLQEQRDQVKNGKQN